MNKDNNYGVADCGFSFDDPRVQKAIKISLEKGKYSTALIASAVGLGQPPVSLLTMWLEEHKIIGPYIGNKPRDLLIKSMEEAEKILRQ